MGLDQEFISLDEVVKKNPLINPKHYISALWDPIDGEVDPSGVTYAYAKSAKVYGAKYYTQTPVIETKQRNDGTWDVITKKGNINAEIIIKATPPGKSTQNLRMLSGGEKAITAIALLFAIYLVKPSPFCILDEVDAPLDDTNVNRFCEIVDEMSKKVQFIIITHNKITMELAKQLSGVTMQEPGVSRLVSVDIDEAVKIVTN